MDGKAFLHEQAKTPNVNFAKEQQQGNDLLPQEKRRQLLRENSPDLRELRAKLSTAHCLKERDAQRIENQLSLARKKNQDASLHKLILGSWEKQHIEDQKREREECLRRKEYGDELKAQMVSEANKKKMLYEEFLKERKLLDEVVAKLYDEDQKAELAHMEKLQKTKKEIERFKIAQALWRQKLQLELEEENDRLVDYLKTRDIAEEKRLEEQRLREITKAEQSEIVARQIYETDMKKKEREAILQVVAEEELLAKQERMNHDEVERKIRLKVNAKASYRQLVRELKERLLIEASQEQVERQEMLEKIAEDSRVEQLTKEKKRLKMIQVRREVEGALEAKRIDRAKELERIARMEELWAKEESTRRQMIEEERMCMLKEHAAKLLGYIPPGVLRESDLPLLGPEFVKMYGPK